jgi:hypothetical protein
VVAAYGFDSTICGTPYHGVTGYRALSVDFTEDSHTGKNTLDFVQHGPILGDLACKQISCHPARILVMLLVPRAVAVNVTPV